MLREESKHKGVLDCLHTLVCFAAFVVSAWYYVGYAIGNLEPNQFGYDFQLRYNETRCVLSGCDPCLISSDGQGGVAGSFHGLEGSIVSGHRNIVGDYPPWVYPLMVPFALLPERVALFAFFALEMFCSLVLLIWGVILGCRLRGKIGDGFLCGAVALMPAYYVVYCLNYLNFGVMIALCIVLLDTGLVNQYDNSNRLVNLAVGTRYPSVTNHLYHWCPHKFFYPGSSQGASSALFSGIGYLRKAARQRPAGKPYGVTEYGEPYWNSHRFQQGLGFGAYSAFQDFDMLIVHSTPVMKAGGELRPFSGGNDPAVRAAEVITGCAFLRGDISPARHRAVWEFDRKFMLKNFDRLTESTASFAALLTGIGLAYEDHPEADLHFPLETASANEFFGSEFYRHFKGSKKFNALVAELRRRGILAADNATDPAKGIYETESGELKLDIMRELLTAVTPRLEGALLPAGETAALPHLKILPGDAEGALALIAQDGSRDLDHCRRALLVCATNALNTHSKFLIQDESEVEGKYISDTEGRVYRPQPGEEVLLDNGHAPVLRQVRRGEFELKLPAVRHPEIYAVRFNGERESRIGCTVRNGLILFRLDASPSPFFEVVARGFAEKAK